MFLLLICTLSLQAQSTNPASQLMQKTSFSCAGRPAGYYADVETGCQVYHMCENLAENENEAAMLTLCWPGLQKNPTELR